MPGAGSVVTVFYSWQSDTPSSINRNFIEAMIAFTRAIELDPEDAQAYYNRGLSYYELGNTKKATINIKIAARLGTIDAQVFLEESRINW